MFDLFIQVIPTDVGQCLIPGFTTKKFLSQNSIRAENFRMVGIQINAWSSLNIETNLILYLYPVYKIQPIRVAYKKPLNLKFCAPFKINIRKREELSK